MLSELAGKGYSRAYSTLSDGLAKYDSRIGKKKRRKTDNLALWRPSKTAMLFFGDQHKLTKQEHDILDELCNESEILN